MATQVTYKGSTIASFTNTSKTLKTSGKYMEDDVTVSESISLQSKTVTPTTSIQTITADSGYEGLDSVTVESAGGGATFIWDEEDSHGGTIRYISTGNAVSGTSTITSNGTFNVASYYSASVNVQPTLQSKTVSPTESLQDITPDSNYQGLSKVTVNAISSTYVGTGVPHKSSADMTISGPTVTAPTGYYSNSANSVMPTATFWTGVEAGYFNNSGINIYRYNGITGSGGATLHINGLNGEPTSFILISTETLTPSSTTQIATIVFDGTTFHEQIITNTNNYQVAYSTNSYFNYSNGQIEIVTLDSNFSTSSYTFIYTCGGTSSDIVTQEVQVGSGATSISFTGLTEEPEFFVCSFKSNFGTSSGYQRVIAVANHNGIYGLEMDSSAKYSNSHWSYTYNNGTLTITSNGTNQGGYFHQPGYYQLTYIKSSSGSDEKWRYRGVVDVNIGEGYNPGYISSGAYYGDYTTFNVVPSGTIIAPTESQQTVGGTNYMMKSAVTINAISSTYVGTGIAQKSAADLTALNSTVTIPSGYYSSQVTKNISSGEAFTPAVTITTNPVVSLNASTGLITASYSGSSSVTPTVTEGYVSSGTAGTIATAGTITYQLTTQASQSITPTESQQTAVASGKYTIGNVTVAAISSNYIGTNIPQKSAADLIVSGPSITTPAGYYSSSAIETVTIGSIGALNTSTTKDTTNSKFKILVNYPDTIPGYIDNVTRIVNGTTVALTLEDKTVAPSTSQQVINPTGNGYYLNSVTVNAMPAGTATTPAATITTNPAFTFVSSTGKLTAAYNGSSSITPTITTGYIFTGTAGTVSTTGTSTYTLTTQAAQTINTSTADQTIASYRWLTGTQTIKSVVTTNIIAENIKNNTVVKVGDANNASRISQVTGTYLAPTYMQSLAYRSQISSGATDFADWISGFTTINSGQFAGQPFSGTFTFTNATTIKPLAFASGLTTTAGSYGSFYYLSCPALTSIGTGAFYFNSKMCRISATNVTTIDAYAFVRCYNMPSISFPSLTTIPTGAFSQCSGLSSASLPLVTTIGSSAFTYCSSLHTIDFPSVTTIYNSAFSRCTTLSTIYLGKVLTVSTYAFQYCINLRTAWLPSVTTIGTGAFYSCYNLMHLMLSQTNNSSLITLASTTAFTSTPISTYTTSTSGYRGSIYVLSAWLASYKAATNWATYSARIVGYSTTNVLASSCFYSGTYESYGITITGTSTARKLTLNGTATSDIALTFYNSGITSYWDMTRDYLYVGWGAGVPQSYGYTELRIAGGGEFISCGTSGNYWSGNQAGGVVTQLAPGGAEMARIESGIFSATGTSHSYVALIHINSGAIFSNKTMYFYLYSLYK